MVEEKKSINDQPTYYFIKDETFEEIKEAIQALVQSQEVEEVKV